MADKAPEQLARALYFKRRGIFVFPVHVPIFDDAGNCTGCTCEGWQREKRHDPTWRCPQPGKCPAVKWGSRATLDEAQLRKWFRPWLQHPSTGNKRYIPNIGIDCGKSRILVLDADTYKDAYAGTDVLSRADEETVTTLTGGGGTHLWYRLPEGKHYSNATGDLPVGIDIRGVGGYIVAPGSLHKSGNEYQFETGYTPHEIELLEVPEALQALLDGAHGNRGQGADGQPPVGPSDIEAVQQSTVLVEQVLAHGDLGHYGAQAWGNGRRYILRDCPFNPADDPHGDDAASFVVIYQDGMVGAGCHHARCQHVIKESGGSGWGLLKQLVDYVPAVDSSKSSEFDDYSDFIQSASGTAALQTQGGFKRAEGARGVLVAMLFECRKQGSYTISIGRRRLGELCGMSHAGVGNILKRLAAAGFVDIEEVEKGNLPAMTLRPCSQLSTFSFHHNGERVEKYEQGRNYYRANRPDDAYISNHYAYKKRRLEMGLSEGTPAMGPAALLVASHLRAYGQMSRSQLQQSTGLGQGAITTAIRRLSEYGQIEVVATGARGAKIYAVTEYAGDALEALRPGMQTHNVGLGRKIKNFEIVLARWKQRYPNRRHLPEDIRKKIDWMEARYEKLVRKSPDTHAYLHRREVRTGSKTTAAVAQNVRVHRRYTEMNRYDRGEEWVANHKPAFEAWQDLSDMDAPTRYRMLDIAGYTREEIQAAIHFAGKMGRTARQFVGVGQKAVAA